MSKRVRLNPEPSDDNAKQTQKPTPGWYFPKSGSAIEFISSGCTILDCVLGGGYPLGRIVNIVGDKSTGKTLLAIEAIANFVLRYPEGNVWYAEVEAAFDKEYAEALGMPLDQVEFVEEIFTVEDMFEDLENRIKSSEETKTKGLYILDSLDALSDRAELSRDMDAGTYGAEKAKKMSQLFRRLTQRLGGNNITVLIISQVRDNIGVTFGAKHIRSGGRAMDFYASQVIRLSQIKELKKTRNKVERTVGIQIKAKCDKNKVGLPFRICQFPIIFGYGVDDLLASLQWLQEVGRLNAIHIKDEKELKAYIKDTQVMGVTELIEEERSIGKIVVDLWQEIEIDFLPTRRKY